MAGGYDHVSGEDGAWSLIENMGDAYECVEELLFLVEFAIGPERSRDILKTVFYPMQRDEIVRTETYYQVQAIMER